MYIMIIFDITFTLYTMHINMINHHVHDTVVVTLEKQIQNKIKGVDAFHQCSVEN